MKEQQRQRDPERARRRDRLVDAAHSAWAALRQVRTQAAAEAWATAVAALVVFDEEEEAHSDNG